MFVTKQLASCIDSTDKLYFIGTDIAIPCNHVQRENALVLKLENFSTFPVGKDVAVLSFSCIYL